MTGVRIERKKSTECKCVAASNQWDGFHYQLYVVRVVCREVRQGREDGAAGVSPPQRIGDIRGVNEFQGV